MDRITHFFAQIPRDPRAANTAAITGVSTVALSAALVWCIRDYRAYLALGPGGPPYNVLGWAMITFLVRPFALSKSATTSTSDYPVEGAHEDIKALPERKGERATVGGIAPHRQLSQHPPAEMREYIKNMFANVVTENRDLLESRLSLYERHNEALFVRASVLSASATASSSASKTPPGTPPRAAHVARGEVGHIHPDFSLHLYLSPADARVVIEKGWAEKHRLSKPESALVKNMFHLADTYLMVYGPRDVEEVEVVSVILRNSVRYMTGCEDVEVPEWKALREVS